MKGEVPNVNRLLFWYLRAELVVPKYALLVPNFLLAVPCVTLVLDNRATLLALLSTKLAVSMCSNRLVVPCGIGVGVGVSTGGAVITLACMPVIVEIFDNIRLVSFSGICGIY